GVYRRRRDGLQLAADGPDPRRSAATPVVGYGFDCSPQAAPCSGGMAVSASGEQFGPRSGITLLLIAPTLPGPGILWVPYVVIAPVGGLGGPAAKRAATTNRPPGGLTPF